MSKASKNANKEYRLASWAIDNPTIIYVLIALFFTVGLASYFSMPREEFPEVIETKIFVSTVYPGNTAEDIERLVVDPLDCLLYTSPSPRDKRQSRMPSSA